MNLRYSFLLLASLASGISPLCAVGPRQFIKFAAEAYPFLTVGAIGLAGGLVAKNWPSRLTSNQKNSLVIGTAATAVGMCAGYEALALGLLALRPRSTLQIAPRIGAFGLSVLGGVIATSCTKVAHGRFSGFSKELQEQRKRQGALNAEWVAWRDSRGLINHPAPSRAFMSTVK